MTTSDLHETRTSRTVRRATAVVASALTLAALTATAVDPAVAAAASPSEADFGVSSGYQTWTVPPGVSSVNLGVIGGGGGDGAFTDPSCARHTGAAGGLASGTLAVTPGQTLTVWVGSGGHLDGTPGAGTPDGTFGGGTGGAAGFAWTSNATAGSGGGGGSASVVWLGSPTNDDIVAIGGGGGGGGGQGLVVFVCGGAGGTGGSPPGVGADSDGGRSAGGTYAITTSGNGGNGSAPTDNGTFQDAGGGGGGGGAGYGTCGFVGARCAGGGGGGDPLGNGSGGGGGGGGSSYLGTSVTNAFSSTSGGSGSAGSVRITWGAPSGVTVNSGVANVGDSVSLRALVQPSDGGGTVAFTSDGKSITGCDAVPFTSGGGDTWAATCTTGSLGAGVHEIDATYSGDAAYAGSVDSNFWTIRQPTSTTVTSSAASPRAGTTLALDALIGNTDGGGSTQFTVDGTPVPGCNAAPVARSTADGQFHSTCATTAPPAGVHTVVATFSGDSVDYGSSGSTPLTTVPATSVPGAPTITSSSYGDTSITVAFTPPASDGGSPITGYVVTARPALGGASITATTTSSPYTLGGLTKGLPYAVTVAAQNALGVGAPSAEADLLPGLRDLGLTLAHGTFTHGGYGYLSATVDALNSPNSSAAPFSVRLAVPTGLKVVSTTAGWGCVRSTAYETCTWTKGLAIGSAVKLTVKFAVAAAAGSTLKFVGTLTPTDDTPADNTASTRVTVTK